MICSSRRFLQKTNKRILLYYYETSGQLVFIRFLEEIEDTKKTFQNYLTFTGYSGVNMMIIHGRYFDKSGPQWSKGESKINDHLRLHQQYAA